MTDEPQPDEDLRSERERLYDQEIAPKLMEVLQLCQKHDMSFIGTVEYEPDGYGTSIQGIGPESGITMKLLQVLTFSRGNIDSFLISCMKKFDMSQTMIGMILKREEVRRGQ